MSDSEIENWPIPSSYNEMMINALTGLNVVSCTVKDVARLAGVSTVTVSRVANSAGNVSNETKTKVLTAMSRLQYYHNAPAAELGNLCTSSKSTISLYKVEGGWVKRCDR